MPPPAKSKKRTAPQSTKPSKKFKPDERRAPVVKKEKAFERPTIPIPVIQDNSDVSDEDIGFFQENLAAGGFLESLDATAISRSKKETDRLFGLTKTPYARVEHVQEPSLEGSASDDDSELNSDMEELELSDGPSDGEENESLGEQSSLADSDEEQSYERLPRKSGDDKREEKKQKVVSRLPIKLPSGQIQQTGVREGSAQRDEDMEEEDEVLPQKHPKPTKRDFGGARFGRASVADVVLIEPRPERIQSAKEQIAGICQDIMSEPENGLGLIRRLLAFAGEIVTVDSEENTMKLRNDPMIRQLAMISLTAVFKDIAPGYRIRKLTEKELSEKVSQMVGQTRDWEQGLVSVYQSYLQLLEKDVRGKTELAEVCLRCMCILLKHLTHFNFRMNIMSTLVARLSRRSWDKASDECLETFIEVFRNDNTGTPSLEAVRLLNRMIKERHYNVHPRVLSCLLSLRLKTELVNVRASKEHVDKATKHSESKAKLKRAKGKGKAVALPHLSKKAKKALKETKGIQAELHEAEAEVDREELATQQTETLKLLFVLYFSILKAAKPSPLLSAALQGIARFAHMVNIDFFRDLLAVLREIMIRTSEVDEEEEEEDDAEGPSIDQEDGLRLQILCVLTAFELLTGQGEALNLDLSHFSTHLYKLIPQLATCLVLDGATVKARQTQDPTMRSTIDTFFRALAIILTPKYGKAPSYLLAAFSKRLLTLSTQLSDPDTVTRVLDFIRSLLGRDQKLDALLSTEERMSDGIYRDNVDDPQLCNPFAAVWWEMMVLEERHYDAKIIALRNHTCTGYRVRSGPKSHLDPTKIMVLADLGRKLNSALSQLNRAPVVDEKVLDGLLKEITNALLEADVNVKLVATLRKQVKAKVKPALESTDKAKEAQRKNIIHKAIHDELVQLVDPGVEPYKPKKGHPNVIMAVGLQGNGKTTTCTKLAVHYQKRGFKCCIVCADTFRAGAFDQTRQSATKAKVHFYGSYTETDPVTIAAAGVAKFKKERFDVIIVDTSGRHRQESELFEEMKQIQAAVKPDMTILVLDASIGQAAEAQSRAFKESADFGAIIVTKMDGHAKGGGAISAVAATKTPIIFLGVGEHLNDLDRFSPQPFINQLLGMGDIQGLMEHMTDMARQNPNRQKEMTKAFEEGKLSIRDWREQMQSIMSMGPLSKITSKIPGMAGLMEGLAGEGTDDEASVRLKRLICITDSMTPAELDSDGLLFMKMGKDGKPVGVTKRVRRVAKGSGASIREVEEVLMQHRMMANVAKQMGGKNGMLQALKGMGGAGRGRGGAPGGMPSAAQIQAMRRMMPPGMMQQMQQMQQNGGMEAMMRNMMGGAGGAGGEGGDMPNMEEMQKMMSQMGGLGGAGAMFSKMMGAMGNR